MCNPWTDAPAHRRRLGLSPLLSQRVNGHRDPLDPRPKIYPVPERSGAENENGDRVTGRRLRKESLNVFARILNWISRKVNPKRPPVCAVCQDDLFLREEVEQGKCVDCQQPAYTRRGAPRPFGGGTGR
jgi:hypothetical protein